MEHATALTGITGIDPGAAAPWLALALLGAFHGVNPAMGWLFAVALGMQQRSRRALLQALLPIAVGHEAAIACAALAVSVLRIVAFDLVRALGAALLIAFGLYKLLRPRSHPRWVGMRLSLRELALWSFLMSSAHGAGLMLLPVLVGLPGPAGAQDLADLAVAETGALYAAGAVVVHTGAMLVVMAAVALLVFEKFGVGVLRRAWIDLDRLWAGAVVVAGVATLFT
jgi:hypothetical protein